MTPGQVLLGLKVAVATVTIVLLASLVALATGRPRWHGRLNTAFFVLTASALLGFEVIIRLVNPELTASFSTEQQESLRLHLAFAVPAAVLLPLMLYTGLRARKRVHLILAVGFIVLWAGTFVTGIFYLPHRFDPGP